MVYYDGQMDDARVNVALATTAARAGAIVTNHTNVEQLLVDGGTGMVRGAKVVDQLTGRGMEVHAKVVVNAAGPFCDRWGGGGGLVGIGFGGWGFEDKVSGV